MTDPAPPPDRPTTASDRLDRLAEVERRWNGPIPPSVLAKALAGSVVVARAAARHAERRALDRTADALRRSIARLRRSLTAAAAPHDRGLARRVADLAALRADTAARDIAWDRLSAG